MPQEVVPALANAPERVLGRVLQLFGSRHDASDDAGHAGGGCPALLRQSHGRCGRSPTALVPKGEDLPVVGAQLISGKEREDQEPALAAGQLLGGENPETIEALERNVGWEGEEDSA